MRSPSSPLVLLVMNGLRWWLRELRACVPGARGGAPSMRPRALIVRVREQEVAFEYRKGRTRTELGRLSTDSIQSSFAQKLLARVRRKAQAWRTSVVLCLQPDSVLRVKVGLPLAAQENLREVLGFEMERLTSFKADEVYYSHRVVDANQAEKRMTVLLMAVPRAIADATIDLVKGWRLKADIVTADAPDVAFDPAMNLLPKAVLARSERGVGRLLVALVAIVIVLAAAIVHLELRQQAGLLAAYEARLAESRESALRVEKLKTEVSQLLTRSRYVAERKQAQPLVSEVFSEVTERLPDNTWVSQFQMKGNEITLSGYSTAASALIEGLEASEILSQVRFTSPITLDGKLAVERFNLAATVSNDGGRQ